MASFWQRNYAAFAKISVPYVGEVATRHSWRGRWAGGIGGFAVPIFVILILASGGTGIGAILGWAVWLIAVLCLIVMIVEFRLTSRAASRHLGVRFRFLRDSRYLTEGRFDAWLAEREKGS